MHWIDLHTHIQMIQQNPDEVIARARSQGLERMILVGTDPEDIFVVQNLAQAHSPWLVCTVGIHPHEAQKYSSQIEKDIENLISQPGVIGIGEIGLDYHYNHSPREIQKQVFRRQMELAAQHKVPVQIHTREAESDTLEILNEFKGKVRGVLHCFTGSPFLAQQALALGWDISLSGVCTFKNADELRALIKTLPMDRIHIETDAPFLAPVPYRGKENEPAYLVQTAQMVAHLLNVDLSTLASQLKQNANRLFPKLQWT